MTQFRAGHRKILLGLLVTACVCLLVITGFNLLDPNARTREAVESILLAESTPRKKLEELAPYVGIGENIAAVHQRIAPDTKEEFHVNRSTEHAYALGDSNLVLAFRADGKIAGIGRHKHGTDDGTVWLAPPEWQRRCDSLRRVHQTRRNTPMHASGEGRQARLYPTDLVETIS